MPAQLTIRWASVLTVMSAITLSAPSAVPRSADPSRILVSYVSLTEYITNTFTYTWYYLRLSRIDQGQSLMRSCVQNWLCVVPGPRTEAFTKKPRHCEEGTVRSLNL
jgi:hypothetical protein